MTRPLLTNLQMLRFVAAAGVLLSHAADLFISPQSVLWVVPWTAGVDMFFVISGFVMTYLTHGRFGEPGAARTFLIRRIIRIAPPYWLFTTLMVIAVLLFSDHIRNTSLNAAAIVTSYLFIPWPRADGMLNPLLSQGWTLNYEAFFYLAFALALLFRRGLAWLAGGFVLLAALHPWLPERLFILKFWSAPIILEFVAGAALALLFLRGVRLPLWGSLGLAGLALALFIMTRSVDAGSFNRLVNFGIPVLLACASLALAPEPNTAGPVRATLVRGGDISYTLYLSHTFAVQSMAILWQALGFGLPWLAMSVSIGVAIAAAALIYRWIERPMTDALQKMAGFRPARGVAAVAP